VSVKGLKFFQLNFKILKDSPLSYDPTFITHDTAAVGKGLARARWCAVEPPCTLPLPWDSPRTGAWRL